MTEAKSPMLGNATKETLAGPKRAAVKQSRAQMLVPTKTFRLSNNLSNPIPMKHPTVSSPQNQETAVAPVVRGS